MRRPAMIHAAFVLVPAGDGLFAATTRPTRPGAIGLPGGKIEPGESPVQAVLREAAEEGWAVEGPLTLVHQAMVDGRQVVWFATCRPAQRLASFKEVGRVQPIAVPLDVIAQSGMGNGDAVASFLSHALPTTVAVN